MWERSNSGLRDFDDSPLQLVSLAPRTTVQVPRTSWVRHGISAAKGRKEVDGE